MEAVQQSQPEPEPEATPEQLEKLSQLQRQIQELEAVQQSQPEPEPEATPEQLEKLSQLQRQIQELEAVQQSQPEPEPEATSEQLEKLSQLQRQIQELEHISHASSFNSEGLDLKESTTKKSESTTNVLNFKKILNNLRSVQSDFKLTGPFTKKLLIESDSEQNKTVESELKHLLFEISEIKKELELFDKTTDFVLDSDSSVLSSERLSKIQKKPTKSKRKKSKIQKKPTKSKRKKSKIQKKPTKSKRKKSKIQKKPTKSER